MADRTISYRLEAQISGFRTQMAQASASTKKLATDLTALDRNGAQMRQGFTMVGSAAGKMGLVAAGGIAAATKAAMDWETAWAGVTKTTDGTAAQMATLEGQLRDLAKTMPATHQEIAAVAEAAGQLGVERDSIASFSRTMLELGETTNLSSDEAATSIAQLANVAGTAPDEIDNLGAALVALGNDGASTERDIIQMAQRISASGAQIGLAESDMLAIANAAASMGVEVEAGGTAISRVFTELAKATASGGPKLQAFAEVAGVTTDEFRRLFAETPADAFAAFTTGLDRINKSGGDVFTTLKNLGMSDVRVSQALLGMAASGDLLTNSLKLGREAWQENTALSDEFAKRLGTTAAQVQVSWNNIKDAAIDAGAAMLPVVEGVAKTVGTLASAFNSLPGPIKAGAGTVVGLTAAVGGTVWAASKMVTAFTEGKQALVDLGIASDLARPKLSSIATAGTAAALGIGSVIDAMSRMDSISRSGAVADATVKGFEDLADAISYSNLGKYADDLHINIGRLTKDLYDNGTSGEYASRVMAQLGEKSSGFGAMVNEQASIILPFWEGSASKAYDAQDDLLKIIDKSSGILGKGADATNAAAGANTKAAGAVANAGDAADGATTDFKALAEAQEASRKRAQGIVDSFDRLGKSVNDSKVSLGDWIKDMREQAKAMRDFRVNAETAARRGLDEGLIASLQEMGPEGALRLKQLANASKQQLGEANAAFAATTRQSNLLGDSLDETGRKRPRPIVSLGGVPAALAELRRLRKELDDNDGRVTQSIVRVIRETRYTQVGSGPGQQVGGIPRAAGGFVEKDGGPYYDRFPHLLAPGEGVTTNRNGETDRFRDVIMGINAGLSRQQIKGMLADGGIVGLADGGFTRAEYNRAAANFNVTPGMSFLEARRELIQFSREIRRAGGSVGRNFDRLSKRIETTATSFNRAKRSLDDLRSARDDARSNAANLFNNDIFGGNLADLRRQLSADTNDARAFDRTIDSLQGRQGLDGGLLRALTASGNLALAQELQGLSRSQVTALERQFSQRASAQSALGAEAASHFTAEINRYSREVTRLGKKIDRLEGAVERGARRGVNDRKKSSNARGHRK